MKLVHVYVSLRWPRIYIDTRRYNGTQYSRKLLFIGYFFIEILFRGVFFLDHHQNYDKIKSFSVMIEASWWKLHAIKLNLSILLWISNIEGGEKKKLFLMFD